MSVSGCKYVFPEEKKWPIYNSKKAMTALTWSTWPQHKKVKGRVQRAVRRCYPGVWKRFEGSKIKSAPEVDELEAPVVDPVIGSMLILGAVLALPLILLKVLK